MPTLPLEFQMPEPGKYALPVTSKCPAMVDVAVVDVAENEGKEGAV